MEWVNGIFLAEKDFLTFFITKREQQIKRWWWTTLKAPTFLREDSELKTKMMVIRSKIQYAYGRRWIY